MKTSLLALVVSLTATEILSNGSTLSSNERHLQGIMQVHPDYYIDKPGLRPSQSYSIHIAGTTLVTMLSFTLFILLFYFRYFYFDE